MKSMRVRLLTAFGFLYAAVLASLGFGIGQLLPAYIDTTIEKRLSASDALSQATNRQVHDALSFWLVLIGALIVAFIVLMLLSNRILHNVTSSVDHVTNTALMC